MTDMTDRQAAAWPAAVERARKVGADVNSDPTHYGWSLHWQDETRPGRGHSLSALWCDGEHFVQITMDVYGYPSVSVASLDWLHADSNEECPCALCVEEREPLDPEDRDVMDTMIKASQRGIGSITMFAKQERPSAIPKETT